MGPTVVIGYYDQHGAELDPAARVENLVAGPHRAPGSLADLELMKRFWFAGELTRARVGTLSGGERRRLQLLVVIAGRPNVLFLDEPTNDLDLDTLRLPRGVPRAVARRPGHRKSRPPSWSGPPSGWWPWPATARCPRWPAARRGGGGPGRTGHRPRSAGAGRTGATTAATAAPAPQTPPTARSAPGAKSAPLGRLLRDAEKQVARLERQRDKITVSLTEASDHVEMTRLGTELAATQAALDQAEETWLALAEESDSGR